ncbi:hypothetical protein ADUPG1_010111 [Aduncisulcus paluster]|uniref:Uncharacterized protein n=1 Tax=Aduncisulcus paluster TaxID=2918883 RepID=A0ABQ5KXX1_9EUKA|nr:hypothetical protein ADUPG1_010111 [Aduncisulcus paluster]
MDNPCEFAHNLISELSDIRSQPSKCKKTLDLIASWFSLKFQRIDPTKTSPKIQDLHLFRESLEYYEPIPDLWLEEGLCLSAQMCANSVASLDSPAVFEKYKRELLSGNTTTKVPPILSKLSSNQRVNLCGDAGSLGTEIIYSATSLQHALYALILDFASSKKTNRKAIFDPKMRFGGVGIALCEYCEGISDVSESSSSTLSYPTDKGPMPHVSAVKTATLTKQLRSSKPSNPKDSIFHAQRYVIVIHLSPRFAPKISKIEEYKKRLSIVSYPPFHPERCFKCHLRLAGLNFASVGPHRFHLKCSPFKCSICGKIMDTDEKAVYGGHGGMEIVHDYCAMQQEEAYLTKLKAAKPPPKVKKIKKKPIKKPAK